MDEIKQRRKNNQSMTQFLKENGAKTSLDIKVQSALLSHIQSDDGHHEGPKRVAAS
jgi:hypothetical protein